MQLKKYNLKGEATGNLTVNENVASASINGQVIKDYITALRANIRQWSANTKGRTEVKCTGKKPHRQKGTGNARQGTLAAPQFRGGGIVFGPRPKFDQKVRVNKKEKRAAVRTLLNQKISSERVFVVEDEAFHSALEKAPKTKIVADFLQSKALLGRRVLFVGESQQEQFDTEIGTISVSVQSDRHDNFKKSVRNLPGCAFAEAPNVNGYDVIASYAIVFTEKAFAQLSEMAG